MSVADLGIEDPSLQEVKQAIEKVFSDTSVSPEETKERMLAIIEDCQDRIVALEEMGDGQ